MTPLRGPDFSKPSSIARQWSRSIGGNGDFFLAIIHTFLASKFMHSPIAGATSTKPASKR